MKRQKFNLHTHTARCGHAAGLDEQYIDSAIHAGFTLLGFSEHIPYPDMRLPNCRMLYEQRQEYMETMRKLQKEYEDQLKIKVGYEVEYLEDHLDHTMKLYQECDYMILGQHCKFIGYEYDCYCSDEDVRFYTMQIEQALEKGFITYVAHPDYFMLGRRVFSDICMEAAHRIAKASIQHDVPLEINLNGFHYGKQKVSFTTASKDQKECYAYPLREFWEVIASYGCKVLFGYDAHSPITLLERDREALAMDILCDIPLNFVDEITLR